MKFLLFSFFSVLAFTQNIVPQKNTPEYFLGIKKEPKELIQSDTLIFKIQWVDSLSLLLPCEDVPIPKKTSRLPNAPRNYRNGTHRGIDFFANWGTPVRSVADAYVIRADHNYIEVPANFRMNLLSATTKVGATPSDIFNSILLGKAVFLDHGFDLIPGFRVISIYAHLSSIENNVSPGAFIKAGQLIGKSGNTGTKESTLGTKKESHLHWEMILQKDENEIYLGKDVSNPLLYETLKRIFSEK